MKEEEKETKGKYSEKLKHVNIRMKPPEDITREERAEFKKKERGNKMLIMISVIAFIVFALVFFFLLPRSWQEFFEGLLP